MKNKCILIWTSKGVHGDPIRVPDGDDPWEFLKTTVVNEADSYQSRTQRGCGIWFHKDDGMAELKHLDDNSYQYFLITNADRDLVGGVHG